MIQFGAILFLLFAQTNASNSQNSGCSADDLRALENFSTGLESKIKGWESRNSCCNWTGINCTDSRVVGLDLSQLDLRGTFSKSLSGLGHLSFLNLSCNSFQGPIPPELFYMQRLEFLDLSNNNFSGQLDRDIGKLLNLVYLDLSFNEFTGFIPDAFYGLKKLESFKAHSNRFSGQLPTSLSSCSMLKVLDLDDNQLTGSINLDFAQLVYLTTLNLGSNMFQGHIPKDLSMCKSLKILNLPKNQLIGHIPRGFIELQALSYLSLANNSLSNISGALSTLQECRNLSTLFLTMGFHGEVMPDYTIRRFESLRVLAIANCGLTGSIPSWLRRTDTLSLVDLSWNHLTGSIPAWLGSLNYLFYLDLSNNSLCGEIPSTLTGLMSLSSNDFLGGENKSSNSYDFPLLNRRVNGTKREYKLYSSFPPTLDLSNNMIDGAIPKELGKLKLLHVLDLSRNNLSGSIPSELSRMINLEKMDLSYNDLSGTIPSTLVKLTFLSSFSVAYNKLEGLIPTGGQFITFPSSSFQGNRGLCGELSFPCSSSTSPSNDQKPNTDHENDMNTTIIGLPFWIGLVVSFFFTISLPFYFSSDHL